ncbi:MAG TPA: helicase-related protein [Burkholderiaceae bacterium]|nr:helicase-related protein [Burkholderiaceae bacterium]
MYAAVAPDMAGARIIAGEWSDADIEQRGLRIVGDVVSEWQDKTARHFGGAVKTIVFSATVNHGAELCRHFAAAGFRFEQISYKNRSDARRRDLIDEFRKPNSQIIGLVSCEVLGRGFDVPDVLCGISARPYRKSLSSHVQQLGRVMRPAPGKEFALWLDHSGNALRFHADTAELFEYGVQSLSDADLDSRARREPDEKTISELKCLGCGFVMSPSAEMCPACGRVRKRRSLFEAAPGQMILIGGRQVPATGKHAFLEFKEEVWSQLCYLARERKGDNPEAGRKFAQAQYLAIYGSFARRIFENTDPVEPSVELRSLVQHNLIRYSKGRAKFARREWAPA